MAKFSRLTEGGHVVIPAEMLHELHLTVCDTLMIEIVDGELHIFTPEHTAKRAQRLLAPYLSGDSSPTDELIAERRAEAESD